MGLYPLMAVAPGAAPCFHEAMASARSLLHVCGTLLLLSLGACAVTIAGDGEGGSGGDPGPVDAGAPEDAGPPPPFLSWRIVAGGDNTCVQSPDGRVACWGDNEVGQLGLGDFIDRQEPAWIPGLSAITEVAAGDGSICARRADSTVWCAGMNYYGELGASTPKCLQLGYACSNVPVQAKVEGATSLGAGTHRYCAALAGGGLSCWGDGPVWDGAGYTILSTAGGLNHTCAQILPAPGEDPARDVMCWGDDTIGQHGDGPEVTYNPTTVAAAGSTPFQQIASGMDFNCGVDGAGDLYCWGQNQYGALGVGVSDTYDYPEYCLNNGGCATSPALVTALPEPVAHVAAHFGYVCAATVTGDVYCWGAASHQSPAGIAACGAGEDCVPLPQQITGVSGAVMVAVGYGHACALTAANEVYCWGLNTHGQLGRGPGGPAFDPTPVKVVLPP